MKIRTIQLSIFVIITSLLQLKAQDKFADIGTNLYNTNDNGLIRPQPPVLENKLIPTTNNKNYSFSPQKTISTSKELSQELVRMREKYIPFMLNIAPKVEMLRKRLEINDFNWRIATLEDSIYSDKVFRGEGKWELVKIPHYAPPLGRARTIYYKEINLDNDIVSQETVFLHFNGVDYKAHVFVNGNYCGSHEGFFAPFEFEISKLLKNGINTIVVNVENDFPTTPNKDSKGNIVVGDKIYAATGPGYDDPKEGWHHGPAGMGIYQECYIETRSKLQIHDIFVRPKLDQSQTEVWVELNSFMDTPAPVKLSISVFGQNFKDTVFTNMEYSPSTIMIPGVGDLVKPTDNEKRLLKMGFGVNFLRIPITMKNFRKWDIETPWLYQVQIKLYDENEKLTDIQTQTFGMRSFTMDTVSTPKGTMYLNGNKIRLRGANTMGFEQQDVIKKDLNQLRDDILLAKIANMNYLRFTQRPVQNEVYEMCDMLGMMNQTDLPLFGSLRRNKFAEAVKQVEELERMVRCHPSTIVVSYINERFPNAEGNPQRSLNTAMEYFQLFKALDQAVLLSNPDRVIKAGDGDYDPPTPGLPDSHCYNTWYNGHGLGLGEMYKGYWQPIKPNWFYACGEFGAEGLDPLNVMQRYYPKEWLPANKEDEKNWNANRISMSQTHRFHYMWYNTQHTLKDWITESQNYQAWAVKFVSETFRRDSRMVSFAIHLFIDAWPAGWMKSIMDVDRQPKKAYFAYRDALAPIISTIRSDRTHFYTGETAPFELWISNDLNNTEQFWLYYQIEQNGKVLLSNRVKADMPINAAKFQGFLNYDMPNVNRRTKYTLRTALKDMQGSDIQQNSFDFEVFPKNITGKRKVYVDTNSLEKTKSTFIDANMQLVNSIFEADIVVFDKIESYKTNQNEIDQFVENGKIVLFMELPTMSSKIANSEVKIEKTKMGNYYFTSPTTGHWMVKNSSPFDFRFWVNDKTSIISPILSNTISAKAWTPILTSGNSTWLADSEPVMSCAELKHGKGYFRICEIHLYDMLKSNPTAADFLIKLCSK